MSDVKRPAAEWRTVLIVDDDRDTREMYSESLRALGFQPMTAASGAEALRIVEVQKPAVVVTDLRLKGQIDGLELTRLLRANDRTKDVRIIVLTGASLNGEPERAAISGADKFLIKPCLPEALAAEIRRAAMAMVSPGTMGSRAKVHRVGRQKDRRKA
jgi:CheY-like chemotaxis protein